MLSSVTFLDVVYCGSKEKPTISASPAEMVMSKLSLKPYACMEWGTPNGNMQVLKHQ